MIKYTEEQKELLRYFSSKIEFNKNLNTWFFSSYTAALRDARLITGRSLLTGKPKKNIGKQLNIKNPLGCWAGALVYLVLIDHIGKFFRNKNPTRIIKDKNDNEIDTPFIKGLSDFSTLLEDEIRALYGLRCAFAHNYGLYNNEDAGDTNKKNIHFFELSISQPSNKIIKLPNKPWDGKDFSDNKKNFITEINIKLLGDLVEDMHFKLKDLVKKNGLEINKSLRGKSFMDNDNELFNRNKIMVYPKVISFTP